MWQLLPPIPWCLKPTLCQQNPLCHFHILFLGNWYPSQHHFLVPWIPHSVTASHSSPQRSVFQSHLTRDIRRAEHSWKHYNHLSRVSATWLRALLLVSLDSGCFHGVFYKNFTPNTASSFLTLICKRIRFFLLSTSLKKIPNPKTSSCLSDSSGMESLNGKSCLPSSWQLPPSSTICGRAQCLLKWWL